MVFDAASVTAGTIKEDQEYEGVRVGCVARLGQARVDVQVDIGFGDAVTPGPVAVRYPALLDLPTAELNVYPTDTVIAEKFQAMTVLGIANSRMKDFFDLWVLAQSYSFDGPVLADAIRATFARRQTLLPTEPPLALTAEFGADRAKVTQWLAFLKKSRLNVEGATLSRVCEFLAMFLMAPAKAAATTHNNASKWPPGGPWAV
ncbi:nucleotidyl transferase AbiEii/AbiGii toxin family protein [soil metagenome]